MLAGAGWESPRPLPLNCSPRRPRPHRRSVSVGLGRLASGGICRSPPRSFRGVPWKRGTPQGYDSSPRAWTAFFDIALRALDMTDPAIHFHMPTHHQTHVAVSDIGYADDFVSLSSSLAGLQYKADLMTAFALLFDLTISAPKLRAAYLGTALPNPSLIIRGPGWTPTTIAVRTHGSITILGLALDLDPAQTSQPRAPGPSTSNHSPSWGTKK